MQGRTYLLTIALLIPLSATTAEDDELSGVYAECAAYYSIAYLALAHPENEAAAAQYFQLKALATVYAVLLALKGRDAELAAEVTKSRIEMYDKKMKAEARNDYANLAILINKYHFGCTEKMENPSERVNELVKEAQEALDS